MSWTAPWSARTGRSPRSGRATRRTRGSSSEVAVAAERYAELAVAAERVRIAREVHDIVAHSLSVIVALADGAAVTIQRDPEQAREAIALAAETGRTALAEMKQSLGVLRTGSDAADRPQVGPEPVLADLDTLLDSVRRTGLQVSYRTTGSTRDLPSMLQLALYRLVQEATTNTVKHARRATRLTVSVRRGQADLRVMVDDNGDPAVSGAPVENTTGHGLLGMRERIALHDGRLFAGPTASGWRVSAWLPLAGVKTRKNV